MLGKKSVKGFFLNVLLLSIGITLAIILLEVTLRLFTPNILKQYEGTRAAMYTDDPELGWKLQRNFQGIEHKKEFLIHIHVNENGFRDESDNEIESGSAFRILGVGNSFTFGFGVEHEETYLELLEGYLNSSQPPGRKYRVFNTGVPGYSLKEYATFLSNSWREFAPDLIMIGIDINDHTDIQPYPKYDVVDGYVVRHRSSDATRTGEQNSLFTKSKIFMHRHSYLCRFLSRAKWNICARLTATHLTEQRENESIRREVEEAWQKASERLDQIRELARENDISLVLLFIPHRSQVHQHLAGDAHIVTEYFRDLDQRLVDYSRRNDVPIVNLLPHFVKSAQRGETLYFLETDAHWNPNGHKLAARVIYDFLIREVIAEEDK